MMYKIIVKNNCSGSEENNTNFFQAEVSMNVIFIHNVQN